MVTTVLLSLLMFWVVLNFIVSFPGDNEYYVDHCTTFTADFWGGFKHGDHCTTFTADVCVVLSIMVTTVLLSLLMFCVVLSMSTTVLLSLLMFWVVLSIMVTTVLLSLLILSASFKYGD